MSVVILEDRCVGCQTCVTVCPADVFDRAAAPGAVPVIARQADCQACFLCELYCPSDALWVDPDCYSAVTPDAAAAAASPSLGAFRRNSGWQEWADGSHPNEHWVMEEMFAVARSRP